MGKLIDFRNRPPGQVGPYDPYTNNPVLASFFVNSNFTNAPRAVVDAANANPEAAQHIYAVWNFLDWMKAGSPELYRAVTGEGLADPVAVVTGGGITPGTAQKDASSGMAGLFDGDYTPAPPGYDPTNPPTVNVSLPGADQGIATDWGSKVFDIAGKYLQYDSQKQIVALNIKRAEQGLAPIDSGLLGPTVNIGASPAVQQLAYIAVGGLILAGIVSAFSKAKK